MSERQVVAYGQHCLATDDIRAVTEVLRSDRLTQGPRIKEFESALAKYTRAKFAVAVSSGTAALHLACLAAGIKSGDEVITSPITFVASANCVLYCGGKTVFADIEKKSFNMDPAKIEKKISRWTRAIIPVHFAGRPCQMKKIRHIAKKHGLFVIEDAAHALGAEYRAQNRWVKTGSCRHSDMTVFSFHPVKLITTGEGGAITTNNEALYKKLKALRSHGIYKDEAITAKHGLWYYEMRELGFNYRITDFQCALGLSQLKKADSFLQRRVRIARFYDEAFKNRDHVQTPVTDAQVKNAYHLYPLMIQFDKIGLDRNKFMRKLRRAGILTQVHYIPVYQQPYYRKQKSERSADFPNSELYYDRTLSIPIHPLMKDGDVRRVIAAIKTLLR